MNNREIQAAWKYHDGSKHSYWSIRNHPHVLDWTNRPQSFKLYPEIEPLPLPRDVPQTRVTALSATSEPAPSSRADSVPSLIVDPAGENRGFHGHRPWLWKSLDPAIQFASRCSHLAFLMDLPARILDAVADRLLVNIQPDVIHNVR